MLRGGQVAGISRDERLDSRRVHFPAGVVSQQIIHGLQFRGIAGVKIRQCGSDAERRRPLPLQIDRADADSRRIAAKRDQKPLRRAQADLFPLGHLFQFLQPAHRNARLFPLNLQTTFPGTAGRQIRHKKKAYGDIGMRQSKRLYQAQMFSKSDQANLVHRARESPRPQQRQTVQMSLQQHV